MGRLLGISWSLQQMIKGEGEGEQRVQENLLNFGHQTGFKEKRITPHKGQGQKSYEITGSAVAS